MHMSNISHLSAAQLHHAAEVQTKIEALQAELAKVLGGTSLPGKSPGKKGKLSSAGRARIIAASRAYWAKVKVGAKPVKAKAVAAKTPAKKRTISAAGRARLVAKAKARWAKIKAAGKNRL